jgi:hypothetical protein
MTARWGNVSIDLDGLGCYHTIHALAEPADPTAIYTVALPRFIEMCARHEVRATLFVIASDLVHDVVRDALRAAVDAGHEVASHSWGHHYALRSQPAAAIAEDFDRAEQIFESALGVRPCGFRAPGYNIDDALLRHVVSRGYRYDSSVFACPPYYAAKGLVMAAMAASGRPSGSAMTRAEALLAPLAPYRPRRDAFWRAGSGTGALPLWEFPVGVIRGIRFPVIGTSLGALSPPAARALLSAHAAGQSFVELEFHGIDFMDHTDSAICAALARRQPDVRRTLARKMAAYDAYLGAMTRVADVHTLATLCDRLDARESAPAA